MNVIFEHLYNSYCTSCTPDMMPVYLRDDPMKAYVQYTFERGFRPGMQSPLPVSPQSSCAA